MEDNGIGYVMRVGCAFRAEVAPETKMRADVAVARLVAQDAWQTCSVAAAKGERAYAWASIATDPALPAHPPPSGHR